MKTKNQVTKSMFAAMTILLFCLVLMILFGMKSVSAEQEEGTSKTYSSPLLNLTVTSNPLNDGKATDWKIAFSNIDDTKMKAIQLQFTDNGGNPLELNDVVAYNHAGYPQSVDLVDNGYTLALEAEPNSFSFTADSANGAKLSVLYSADGSSNYLPIQELSNIDLSEMVISSESSSESTTSSSSTIETTTESPTESMIDPTELLDKSMTVMKPTARVARSLDEHQDSSSDSDDFDFSKTAGLTGSPTIPVGGIQLGEIFAEPVTQILNTGGGQKGESKVQTIDPPDGTNKGLPYSQISLTGQYNQVAIFSNDDYRLNFNEDFNGRVYVNFGTNAADGFAFVMQNDDRGSSAITKAHGQQDGQNLGVYGDARQKDWAAKNAIQHSIAIEFDLNLNKDYTGANFDRELTGYNSSSSILTEIAAPHMAYSFPGNVEKGYMPSNGSSWESSGDYAMVQHNEPIFLGGVDGSNAAIKIASSGTLIDGTLMDGAKPSSYVPLGPEKSVRNGNWYSFRYQYDTDKGFTYYLVDPGTQTILTKPVTISNDDLKTELNLDDNGNQAYWGFTAANGDNAGTTKFVFSQVPVDLSTTMNNQVLDEQGKLESSEDETVSKDELFMGKGRQATFKTDFTLDKGESEINITNWTATVDPTIVDTTKIGSPQIVVKGNTITGNAIPDEHGKISINFDIGAVVSLGEKAELSFTAPLLSPSDDVLSTFHSDVTGKETVRGLVRSFPSNTVYYWVVQSDAPTELAWDANGDTSDRAPFEKGLNDIKKNGLTDGKLYWRDLDVGNKLHLDIKDANGQVVWSSEDLTSTGSEDFTEQAFTLPKEADLNERASPYDIGDHSYVAEIFNDTLSPDTPQATLDFVVNIKDNPAELAWDDKGDKADKLIDSGGDLLPSTNDSTELENNSIDIGDAADGKIHGTLYWKDEDVGDKLTIEIVGVGNESTEPYFTTNVTSDGSGFHNLKFTLFGNEILAPWLGYTYGSQKFKAIIHKQGSNRTKIEDTLTFTVNLVGKLSLIDVNTPDDNMLKWSLYVDESYNNNGHPISRAKNNNLTITVRDSRQQSDKSSDAKDKIPNNWYMFASLIDQSKQSIEERNPIIPFQRHTIDSAPYDFVWKDTETTNGEDHRELGRNEVPIPTDSFKEKEISINLKEKINIYNGEWSPNAGVLLTTKNYLSVGNYYGIQIGWRISDIPQPE